MFVFGIFYKDMVDMVSEMPYGTKIGSHTYNVFSYADDILLLSVAPKGLQKLIDAANCYITGHGLGFNPSKSICVVFGKSKLSCLRWYLKGSTLTICDSVKFLGVVLSNRTDSHSSQRLKAARDAFYTLHGAGLCVDGVQSEAMTRIYKQAVQPVLLYGMNCVFKTRKVYNR